MIRFLCISFVFCSLSFFGAPSVSAEVNWRNLRCGEYDGSDSTWSDVKIIFNYENEYLIMKWKNKSLKIFPQRERVAGARNNVGIFEVKDQYNKDWTLVQTHTSDPVYFRFWLGRPNLNDPRGEDIYILCKDRRANNW